MSDAPYKMNGIDHHQTHRGPGIKQWRLVVRNLPFDTTKEEVLELVSKYGTVKEISLPRCKDQRFPNSCAGFCFVQFSRSRDAEVAQSKLNFTDFKHRKIALDWAMDKDSYVTMAHEERKTQQIKLEEANENMASQIKKSVGNGKTLSKKFKEESPEPDKDSDVDSDDLPEDNLIEKRDNNITSEDDDEFNDKAKKKRRKRDLSEKEKNKATKTDDPAVTEGRVIFLKNVPFDVTNEDIKSEAAKFGNVALSITCKYHDSGLPNGSAFVHFDKKESADAFLDRLQTEEGVQICSRKVIGYRAVPRSEAESFKKNTEKCVKDKRNLYLLRASLIRPGTQQAKGMSEKDAEQRERLAQAAKTKLKNLLMFVSPTRLVIHNIPFSTTDEDLRKLCAKAAACDASNLTECRIMKQKKGEDSKGRSILGKSKGFAFVALKDHPTTLKLLQNMNNNPNIFTEEKRPIVEFSIESLKAIQIKEKRMSRPLRVQDDPEVRKTKQKLMAGGKKWLPKKFGLKTRHKTDGKNTSNIRHGKVTKKKSK